MKKIFLTLALLFATSFAGAQLTTISGTPLDGQGNTVPNGVISFALENCIQYPTVLFVKNVFLDSNGAFSVALPETVSPINYNGVSTTCTGIPYYTVTFRNPPVNSSFGGQTSGSIIWIESYEYLSNTGNLSNPLTTLPTGVGESLAIPFNEMGTITGHTAFGSAEVDQNFPNIGSLFDGASSGVFPASSNSSYLLSTTNPIGSNGITNELDYSPVGNVSGTSPSALSSIMVFNLDNYSASSSNMYEGTQLGIINTSNSVKTQETFGILESNENFGSGEVVVENALQAWDTNNGTVDQYDGINVNYIQGSSGINKNFAAFVAAAPVGGTYQGFDVGVWIGPQQAHSTGYNFGIYSSGEEPSFFQGPLQSSWGFSGGAVTTNDLVISQLNSPAAPTGVVSSSGGSISAGTYYYKLVAIDSAGNHTSVSSEVTKTTSGSSSSIAWTGTVLSGASTYQLWVGTTSGGENSYFTLTPSASTSIVVTINAAPVLTYTQTATSGTSGTMPSSNTTGNLTIGSTVVIPSSATGNAGTSTGKVELVQTCITGSIGGSALTAGQTASGSCSITTSATGHPALATESDGSNIGGSYNIRATVNGTTVTVAVQDIIAGTPSSKTYNVTVF